MNPVRTVYNKEWIPYKNRVDFHLTGTPVEFTAPVTTVHGFFWHSERLLLVRHKSRGWEVPGGHIESGEHYEAAMRRELAEEAQMRCGDIRWLGYLEKTALEDKPQECDYPHPKSYCIFFTGEIDQIEFFEGDDSIEEAAFFSNEEALNVPWIKAYREFFEGSQISS